MSSESATHLEISELLPWYVNGTLDGDEKRRVRRHLESCPECQADRDFLRSVSAAVRKSSPAPIVPTAPVESLLASIDAVESPAVSRDVGWFRVAATVAAIFVAGAIYYYADGRGADRSPLRSAAFETATETVDLPSLRYRLQLEFHQGTSVAERRAVIDALDGREVSAEGELVHVQVQIPGGTLRDVERYTESIQSHPAVDSVEVSLLPQDPGN